MKFCILRNLLKIISVDNKIECKNSLPLPNWKKFNPSSVDSKFFKNKSKADHRHHYCHYQHCLNCYQHEIREGKTDIE